MDTYEELGAELRNLQLLVGAHSEELSVASCQEEQENGLQHQRPLAPPENSERVSIERPCWVAFISFLMMAWPEKALSLVPFMTAGGDRREACYRDLETLEAVEVAVESFFKSPIEILEWVPQSEEGWDLRSGVIPSVVISQSPSATIAIRTIPVFPKTPDPFISLKLQWTRMNPSEVWQSGMELYVWGPYRLVRSYLGTIKAPTKKISIRGHLGAVRRFPHVFWKKSNTANYW